MRTGLFVSFIYCISSDKHQALYPVYTILETKFGKQVTKFASQSPIMVDFWPLFHRKKCCLLAEIWYM